MKNNSLFGAVVALAGVLACKVAHNRGYVKAMKECARDLDLALDVAKSVVEKENGKES